MKTDKWQYCIWRQTNDSTVHEDRQITVLYMKTNIHFLTYLAQFFLEWEMFQTEVVEEIKTHILFQITFCRKSYRLWDNVEKYRSAGRPQMAIWSMRIACWIPKATHTQSQYVILIAFPHQRCMKGLASMIHRYVNYLYCKFWQQRYILAAALIVDRWNACGTNDHQIPAGFWHRPGLFMQDITILFLVTWFYKQRLEFIKKKITCMLLAVQKVRCGKWRRQF